MSNLKSRIVRMWAIIGVFIIGAVILFTLGVFRSDSYMLQGGLIMAVFALMFALLAIWAGKRGKKMEAQTA